jgi:hypothetical protein
MLMGEAKVVNRGVDTLVVNVYHTARAGNPTKQELDSSLPMQLEEWKRSAREAGEPITTTYEFNGLSLKSVARQFGRTGESLRRLVKRRQA